MKSETARIVAQPNRRWSPNPAGPPAALVTKGDAALRSKEWLLNDDGVTSVQPRSAYNQVHESRS